MGILGMEERVRHLGGSFHIDSHPGQGTTVSVDLPLAPARELAAAGQMIP